MVATATNWRRTAAARIRRLSPEQARAIIATCSTRGATIFHPEIRELTGGFNSQNINFWVMRKLGIKAGLVKGGK